MGSDSLIFFVGFASHLSFSVESQGCVSMVVFCFILFLHRGLALSPLVAWSDKESHSRDYDAYTFLIYCICIYKWGKEPLDMGIEEIRRVTSVLSSHMVNSALPRTLFRRLTLAAPNSFLQARITLCLRQPTTLFPRKIVAQTCA